MTAIGTPSKQRILARSQTSLPGATPSSSASASEASRGAQRSTREVTASPRCRPCSVKLTMASLPWLTGLVNQPLRSAERTRSFSASRASARRIVIRLTLSRCASARSDSNRLSAPSSPDRISASRTAAACS